MDNYLLLLLAGLAWAFLCWKRQMIALVLLVLLTPTYQIRYEIFGIPTTVLEWLIVILFFVWLLRTRQQKEKILFPYRWIILLFVLAGCIATATSVDPRAGLGLLKAYIIEPVALYLVFVNVLKTKRQIRLIVFAFAALVGVVSFVAILQALHVVGVPEPYASEMPRRVTSFFDFPTAVGKLVGPLVAYLLAFTVHLFRSNDERRHSRAAWYGLVSILGLFALFFSVNQGALLGLAVSIFFILWFVPWRKIAFALLIMFAVLSLMIPQVQKGFANILTREDTSTNVRIVMWQGTLRLLSAHPVTGAGLGGFPELYDQYRDASHVELFPNPDQLLLTLWVELGLFGFLVFIILMGIFTRQAIGVIRGNGPVTFPWHIGIATLSFFISFVVHGMVDTPYFKNDLSVIFWVVLALLIATKRLEPSEK